MSDTTHPQSDRPEEQKLDIDEKELERLNREMILSDLITPDKLYVDLVLVKDFNIGALLSFLHEMKTTRPDVDRGALYRSIIENLKSYQSRKFDDIAYHFPKFGLTTDDVRARLRDPKWSSYILHNSPITPYVDTLKGQLAVNANHSLVCGKKDHIDIVVNTYPLQLKGMDKHIVGLYFAQQFKVRVNVVYIDMTKITLDDVVGYDEIYTYYFKELFDHEDIRNGYTSLKFIRKRLFVPRIFGLKHTPTLDTEREELVVKSRCDILTMLEFFPAKLCSALMPETDKTQEEEMKSRVG